MVHTEDLIHKLTPREVSLSRCSGESPSRRGLKDLVRQVRMVVFSSLYWDGSSQESLRDFLSLRITKISEILREQLYRGICFSCTQRRKENCKDIAHDWADQILEALPQLQSLLEKDVDAAYRGDPAAVSRGEIVYSYPSIEAMLHYRLAHAMYRIGVPFIPRILTELAHSSTGIDIHPAATIGEYFFIDHGTGVVIGSTTIIGNHCRLYQGVTLGAANFKTDKDGSIIRDNRKRHPTLKDSVVVYAEATILGDITIGEGAVIGGNLWVTEHVEPGVKVLQPSYATQLPSRK